MKSLEASYIYFNYFIKIYKMAATFAYMHNHIKKYENLIFLLYFTCFNTDFFKQELVSKHLLRRCFLTKTINLSVKRCQKIKWKHVKFS